ncbi:hypothetical protein LSTR_LSTR014129, partial [Laodelphax striatellus]
MSNADIEWMENTKFLRVFIDQCRTWRLHVEILRSIKKDDLLTIFLHSGGVSEGTMSAKHKKESSDETESATVPDSTTREKLAFAIVSSVIMKRKDGNFYLGTVDE